MVTTWGAPVAAEPAYIGRHREPGRRVAPLARPLDDWSLYFEHLEIALRHMGAVPVRLDENGEPAQLMGPWSDARHPDEAWALADGDLADMRAARQLAGATT